VDRALKSGEILKETDLIYEGIATMLIFSGISIDVSNKETDLIYEGIATWEILYRVDLCPLLGKETDLIYEGIATSLIGALVVFSYPKRN